MAHRRWVTTAVALVVSVALGRTTPADGVADATRPATRPDRPTARHVVLIGLDGARADAVRDHAGPALRSLIAGGTSCWNVEAVRPSVTQTNWASILTGRTPEAHGIDRHPVTEEQLGGVKVKVPTLFELVAATGRPAAGFLGHWKLYPNETAAPGAHVVRSPYEASRVVPVAAAYVARERPAFCFVYLGDLDGLGHRHGWMSDEYLRGLAADVDAGIATILDALDVAGIRDETVVLVTSDHGGHGKGHSQGTAEDLLVPWVAAGPGVRRGHVIRGPASTLDTAPTILRALGVAVPSRCDGSPLVEAFETPPASPITR